MIHFWRLFLLLIVLAAGLGSGAFVLYIAGYSKNFSSLKIRLLLSITLGLGILSYSILFIGLFGFLYQEVIWSLLIVGVMAGIYTFRKERIFMVFKRRFNILKFLKELDWFNKLLLAFLITFILINLIGALAPPLVVDDIKYHLAIPKRYVEAGAITYIPDIYFSNFPFPMEMLWTLAICIDSGELAQLINWSIGLLVIGWIVILGNKSGLQTALTVLPVSLFYSITTVGAQSRSGMVELGGVLFFLACVYLINEYKEFAERKPLILGGILCGLFAVVKLSNAAMMILLTIWIVYSIWRKKKSFRAGLSSGILFGSVALLVAGVWYVKTYLMTGNPVYPFLQSIFGGSPIHTELLTWGDHEIINADNSLGHLSKTHYRLFSQWWYLIAEPQRLRGHVSPLFLCMLPLVLLNYRKENNYLKEILIVAGLFYVYWVAFYPMLRIGLSIFAMLSIPVSVAIYRVMAWGKYFKVCMNILIVAFLLTSLGIHSRDVLPRLPVVFGAQTRTDHINLYGSKRYRFFNYPAFNYINKQLPSKSKILLWSNDGYYLDRDYLYVTGFITNMADGEKIYDLEQVIDELKKFGITHVAMTDNYLRKKLKDTLLETEKLDILYQDKHMIVASLQ